MFNFVYTKLENKKALHSLVLAVFLIKMVFAILFSSDYQNILFLPFVEHFISNFDSPWQFAFENKLNTDFPYQPLMLYIYSFFLFPFKTFFQNQLIANFVFKLPTLIADIGITVLLLRMFPHNKLKVVLFYVLSPIVFYAAYMHSQLDLIPTVLLFFSVYFLTKQKAFTSSIFFGLALATKLHVLLILPILLIYVYKNFRKEISLYYLLISLGIFGFFVFPYFSSEGFQAIVLNNPKQMLLYNSFYQIGAFNLYLPLFITTVLYSRFFAYKKVNQDLLFSYIGIIFITILLLIPPAPAWYLWLFPFISIFLIKNSQDRQILFPLYLALSFLYLVFFVLFFQENLHDLIFINTNINLKINSEKLTNIVFTLLEVTLLALVYAFYHFGVKSNQVYLREQSVVIGIGGNSGSGKTTLLQNLQKLLGNKLLEIEGDGEHKWERGNENWKKTTHLDPKANYLHKQADNIIKLKRGLNIQRTEYDHDTGTLTEAQTIQPKDFIVICGLHPFYLPKLRKTIDLKIFLDTDAELIKRWKINRDMKKRGYSEEKAIKQIEEREKDSKTYINRQKQFADLAVHFSSSQKNTTPDKLKVTLNSSIHVEDFVYELQEKNIEINWEYTDDLNTQLITLNNQIETKEISQLIKNYIPNSEELLRENYQIAENLNGFLQFIILLLLSHKMQHEI